MSKIDEAWEKFEKETSFSRIGDKDSYYAGFENAIKLVLENVTTDCQWCSGYGNCTVDEDSILNLLK